MSGTCDFSGFDDPERAERIVRMYLEGVWTLEEVGEVEGGITRERVRQIVRKAGVTREESMAAKRRANEVSVPCDECGQPVTRSGGINGSAVFCGRACAARFRGRAQTISDDELLRALRELAAKLGKTPGQRDMNRHGPYSHMVYVRHFGSLRRAQEAAGLNANGRGAHGHNTPLPADFAA